MTALDGRGIFGVWLDSNAAALVTYTEICAQGSYCPGGRGATAVDCPAGYICPMADMLEPEVCPPGYYSSTAGASTCSQCLAGKICPTAGLTSHQLCPQGFICDASALITPSGICSAGKTCSTGLVSPNSGNSCPVGFFCLIGTSPSGYLTPQECVAGTICKTGASKPTGTQLC